MSNYRIPIIVYIFLLKFVSIMGQWNNYQYCPASFSTPTTCKLPVQYVPAQTVVSQPNCYQYPVAEALPLNEPYPGNVYPPYPDNAYPIYPNNNPGDITIPPSYPGQPVIVINNGGGAGGPGDGGSDFDIGELLTFMLAFNGGGLLGHSGHHHGHHGAPKQEAPKEEPDDPYPPPFYGYPGFYPGINGCYPGFYPGADGSYPGFNGFYPGFFPGADSDVPKVCKPKERECSKCDSSINITIVLPNNSAASTSVQVDSKNKDDDCKKCKLDKTDCKDDSE